MGLNQVLRRLRRSPMFTVVTLLTLAIGIGANTAVFSVLNGVLLKPLPYRNAGELIAVNHAAPGVKMNELGSAPFLNITYREQNRTLQDVGMWNNDSVAVTGAAQPEQVEAIDVTDGILPMLGAKPVAGRLFTRDDSSSKAQNVVILSYAYWQSHYGGDRSAIGRTLVGDGQQQTIVGVLPADFHFLDANPALYEIMQFDRAKIHLGNFSYRSLARLKPGVSIAQASADAARLIPVAIESFPPPGGYSSKMFSEARLAPYFRPLKEEVVGDVGSVLWVLMATIGIVLVIACANVANLLLVRTEGRQQELAIRAALGAGSGRIARALFAESVMLALCGGAMGLALAYGAIKWLVALAPANLPRLNEISIDAPVLLFTFAASLLAGLLFGAIPVLKYAGPRISETLRGGGRSISASRQRHRARGVLVVVQVALAMLLLICSGLMLRTFQSLRQVQPGFTHPEGVQTVRFFIPEEHVKDPVQTVRMQQNIAEKIASLPHVESVALTSVVPMDDGGWHDPVYVDDRVYTETSLPPIRSYRIVSPGLLHTLGRPLAAGRDFTWTDVYDMRPVAMISENMAREYWREPGKALGHRIRETLTSPWREIVGVVSDGHDDGVDKDPPGVAYWPLLMKNFAGNDINIRRGLTLVIRSGRTGSSGFLQDVGNAMWSINPQLPMAHPRTLTQLYDKSLARTSFALVMLAIAGAMALLLGLIGIYGVISYSVSQRKREIGIRMALGSPQSDVTRLFLRDGLRLSAIGVMCGLIAAVACTRLMSALLFHVKAVDPLTFAGVACGLVAAAALASYLPALRASAVDPTEALRAE